MVKKNPLTGDIVARLIQRIESDHHRKTANEWNKAMLNGSVVYGRPIGQDTRRIYLNAANKFWEYLKQDYSNLYEAVVLAIENCKPHQFSSRKHIKEASISLTKFLIAEGEINE
jgi:hypothetical protein